MDPGGAMTSNVLGGQPISTESAWTMAADMRFGDMWNIILPLVRVFRIAYYIIYLQLCWKMMIMMKLAPGKKHTMMSALQTDQWRLSLAMGRSISTMFLTYFHEFISESSKSKEHLSTATNTWRERTLSEECSR